MAFYNDIRNRLDNLENSIHLRFKDSGWGQEFKPIYIKQHDVDQTRLIFEVDLEFLFGDIAIDQLRSITMIDTKHPQFKLAKKFKYKIVSDKGLLNNKTHEYLTSITPYLFQKILEGVYFEDCEDLFEEFTNIQLRYLLVEDSYLNEYVVKNDWNQAGYFYKWFQITLNRLDRTFHVKPYWFI